MTVFLFFPIRVCSLETWGHSAISPKLKFNLNNLWIIFVLEKASLSAVSYDMTGCGDSRGRRGTRKAAVEEGVGDPIVVLALKHSHKCGRSSHKH